MSVDEWFYNQAEQPEGNDGPDPEYPHEVDYYWPQDEDDLNYGRSDK